MRLFGYSEEEMRRARWRVVEALRRGLGRRVLWAPEAEGVVQQVLGVVANDPEEWAERVGMGLREALEGEVQARRMVAGQVERLQREVERLRGMVEGYEREAPAERLRALEVERERLRQEVGQWRERVRVLEERLRQMEERHREEVERLREEILVRNRVIVRQQEALNALQGGRRRAGALSDDETTGD